MNECYRANEEPKITHLKAPIPVSGPSSSSEFPSVLKDDRASLTAFSMNSSLIRLDGCSLKTEFIRAIFAELRRASAFVGQLCGLKFIEIYLLWNGNLFMPKKTSVKLESLT